MNKRIEWIDTSRGILIVCVVLGHVIASYQAANLYLDSTVMNFISHFIYSFHMASFMFLSGLLFKKRENSQSQIKRILIAYGIPYLLFSIVWFLFKFFLRRFVNSELDFLDLILIPFFPISFMWFIYALMVMEILQVIICKQSLKVKYAQFFISLSMYLINPIVGNYPLMTSKYTFSDSIVSDIMGFYVFFVVGTLWGNNIIDYVKKYKIEVLVFSWGGILLLNILSFEYSVIDNHVFRVMSAACGIVFIISLGMSLNSHLLLYIGQRTLCIYVLQGICIAATRVLMSRVHLNDFIGIFPLFICTIIGTVMPLLIYEVSKKIGKIDFVFTPLKYIK